MKSPRWRRPAWRPDRARRDGRSGTLEAITLKLRASIQIRPGDADSGARAAAEVSAKPRLPVRMKTVFQTRLLTSTPAPKKNRPTYGVSIPHDGHGVEIGEMRA